MGLSRYVTVSSPKTYLLCCDIAKVNTRVILSFDRASLSPLQADQLATHRGHAYEDVELLDGYQAQYLK